MEEDPTLATQLLKRISSGDDAAGEELAPMLYGALRDIAAEWMSKQSSDHTLQPTALVNEAWLRLFSCEVVQSFNGRGHFLKAAACAMRSVLVDHARSKRAAKRGEARRSLPLDAALHIFEERSLDVVELSDAVDRLARSRADLARVVELRFFGGLTIPETAEALGVSTQTIDRRWRVARLWLQDQL
ncbi:RNA polymerase sigma factor SigL [Planctomycetes bacterium Poly30]|uniref:RNA polymerase sigma factor SigL n=1 Tax=Saltatorellus ferox TaxID=2528018 RepID=A0A518EYU9_9BACT|nr:RNA polymerase sigma factor SigL [Planctomycetes bacterium Poly30]